MHRSILSATLLQTPSTGVRLQHETTSNFIKFIHQGFGETDQGGGADPYETGSYDLALEDAGQLDAVQSKFLVVTRCVCLWGEEVQQEVVMVWKSDHKWYYL